MRTEPDQACGHRQPNGPYRCTKKAGHLVGMHGEHRVEGGGFAATWPADTGVSPALLQNATLPDLFRQLPLPQRMRLAAEVLDDVNMRLDEPDRPLAPLLDAKVLRIIADRWEQYDNREAVQDLLARELANAFRLRADDGATALVIARELVAGGWTKTPPRPDEQGSV